MNITREMFKACIDEVSQRMQRGYGAHRVPTSAGLTLDSLIKRERETVPACLSLSDSGAETDSESVSQPT